MDHDTMCYQKHVLEICYVCEFINRIREDERNRLAQISKVRLSTNARNTSRSADDEIEVLTGLTHQTASATRNSLMRDGLIVVSGDARTNRRGNASIVWKVNT